MLNVADEQSTFELPDSMSDESIELLVVNRSAGTLTDVDGESRTRGRRRPCSVRNDDEMTLEPYGARVYRLT